jgi:hypothetical protein
MENAVRFVAVTLAFFYRRYLYVRAIIPIMSGRHAGVPPAAPGGGSPE